MKDRNGLDIVRGDLIMIIIDTPIHKPSELVIYLDNEDYVYKVTEDGEEKSKETKHVIYYPLSDEGLEVANYDNGSASSLIHREKKFKITNINSDNIIKADSSNLRGYAKTLYDSIIVLV
jgi:hypothetical protein